MITRPDNTSAESFDLRRIAIPAFGPSLLFGLGKGAILPVVALSVRDLGGSPALAALVVMLIGIGSLPSNVPASLITARYGERTAIVGAAIVGALAMLLCALVPNLRVFSAQCWSVRCAHRARSSCHCGPTAVSMRRPRP